MRDRPGRGAPRNLLSPRHRHWTYAAWAAVVLTGLAWLLAHFLYAHDCEFGQCRSALEPWILRLHGGAALLALIQFGTLLPSHVARGWRVGQNRAPGAVVVAGVALLLASGYGLYYVGNESGRAAISALHWITGIALIPLFLTHLYVGRRADTEAVPDLDTEVVHSPFGRHAESASGHKRHRRRHLR